ncbi:hypothetical protein CMK22_13685 [Candidatus Poribacteria bacterium]|nr:hypothetical protein [Candidatus Poribacteria bacterium]
MQNEIGIAGWLYSHQILHEKTLTLLEFPATCASHGIKTVELCSAFFNSQEARYINDLRQALEDQDLSVRNIAVDMGNLAGTDPSIRRTDIESLKQWFYVASAINSPAIRINTGHADDSDALSRVVDGYQELTDVGQQVGVKLLMENHGGLSAHSNGLSSILACLDSDWFGTCPDTANFLPDDSEEGMRVLAPRAFSCHVKVFNHSLDGLQSWDRQANGNMKSYNLRTSLEILKDSGYEGPLCIERSVPKEPDLDPTTGIRNTIRYVKDLLASIP